MIHRLYLFILLIGPSLNGQIAHLMPDMLSSKAPTLDSLGYDFKVADLPNWLQACGQFNQQVAATLISDQGLVLVARSAVLPYLPEKVDPKIAFWAQNAADEILLPKAFITFQLDYQDVTSQLMEGVEEADSEVKRTSRIARNRVQLKMKTPRNAGATTVIKELNAGQTYHLYRLLTFKELHLVGLPADADGQAFALLRITPQKENLKIKSLSFSKEQGAEKGIKATIIDFPANSHFNASSYELTLHQIRSEITRELDLKMLQAYQRLGANTPPKLLARNQQNEVIHTYFQETDLFAQRKAKEQALLLDPACRKTLTQLDRNFDKFETLYTLHTYGQEAFARVKLNQLVNILKQIIKRGPTEYEKSRKRINNYLITFLKDWNVIVDQEIFAAMAEAYFSRTKAQYLSSETIEKIAVTNKSYPDLADLIYTNTILTQPEILEELLSKDLEEIEKKLNQDLAFRFLGQLAVDFEKKLAPTYRKENNIFKMQTRNLAQQRQSYLPKQWITEANGSQRVHFTTLSKQDTNTWFASVPGLANTDMAPILDRNGQLLGFRPEDEQLSSAYAWEQEEALNPIHPVVHSAAILKYLDKQPQATYLLKEIKKAP